MLTFVTIVHVLLCVFMIFVILLQPGKDAGMGSALGGGAATSAFGGRGATTFLTKITGICAAMFFLTSLGLSFVGMRTSVAGSLANKPAATQPAPAPQQGTAAPGAGAPPAGQIPPANPQEAAPPSGAAPAAPGSVEQPRPADAPAPAPAPGQ
ncbi:protein translocase subunit secG [Archangium gephyra]|uniref:Protein-export membrane protein SecG n=1 Tax=Archangium gephyra TaxID=48 RepID=A0AAC8QDA8_9BACT|nr:preprotein translocase subunit SecG [Archangium gephyra]AKJ05199.1 Preprotein translocase subunit SecG [Archangium gephyra]REG35893.1 protein translocase subunit secG [Archangium gephyra]